jgi:CheY-like chemotaxis protein
LLARRETYAPPVVREFTDQALAGRVVLVVDDDRLVHAIVDRVLAGFDGILLHAYTGTDALRIAWQVRPNLILTDALLPGVDGRELSKAVKSEPALSHTTVIVMTALYKGARYRQEAFTEYLVDGYVEKPLSAMKLRSTIEGALEHDAAAQESIETEPQAQDLAN